MNAVVTNVIVNLLEEAIASNIREAIQSWSVPVYTSDQNADKTPMPYVVIHVGDYEEIAPGCGIFRVSVDGWFRSHTKVESEQMRRSVMQEINNFAWSDAATKLTAGQLTVYGFIPGASGNISVNAEMKCYEYNFRWRVDCMPRPNE